MNGIPVHFAFLLGGLVGAVGYGPVRRWVRALRRTQSGEAQRPGSPREDSRLMLVFVTMHPAPWLVLFGVPFLLYQLAFGPLPMLWLTLLLGMLAGAALGSGFASLMARRRQS